MKRVINCNSVEKSNRNSREGVTNGKRLWFLLAELKEIERNVVKSVQCAFLFVQKCK